MIKNFDKLVEELRNAVYETIEHGYKANQVAIEVSEELFNYLWNYHNAIFGGEIGDIRYRKGYFLGIPIIAENVETFKILVEARDE